jgi:deoxycytidylate deaminase
MSKYILVLLNPNIEEVSLNGIDILADYEEVTLVNILQKDFFDKCGDICNANIMDYYTRNFKPEVVAKIILSYLDEHLSDAKVIVKDIDCYQLIKQLQRLSRDTVYIAAYTVKGDVSKKDIHPKILDFYLHADFYVNCFANDKGKKTWERIISVLEKTHYTPIPTSLEMNMYSAYTAMYNSHCLSRAVGASITTNENILITSGWNDVPKAGGGVYEHSSQNHCFLWDDNGKIQQPGCHKDFENKSIIEEIKQELKEQGVSITEKEEYILDAISKLQIKGLLEFSRSVHAEMHTIIKASQMVGEKVKNSTLYVTAFPCHNCARHIILSGVSKVYYIEPFLKSRALKLHGDSLLLANNEQEARVSDPDKTKVWLMPFEGINGKNFNHFYAREGDMKKVKDKPLFY